jgi:hypothetical protein
LDAFIFAVMLGTFICSIVSAIFLGTYLRHLREDPEYSTAQFFLNPQGRRLILFLVFGYVILSANFIANSFVRSAAVDESINLVALAIFATFSVMSVRLLSKPASAFADADAVARGRAPLRGGGTAE